MDQLIGIDADGGNSHTGGHDRNFDALIAAGEAEDVADRIKLDRILKEILGDEFCSQRIAGEKYGFCDITFFSVVMWCRHNYLLFWENGFIKSIV